MKTKALFLTLLIWGTVIQSTAQQVRVRLNFPVTVRVGTPGPAPYRGAVWIGPEWRWQQGAYVSMPGFWGRPAYNRAFWIPGHWQHTRRGYRWMPGRWK